MATHSSILAWRMPWTEEPGRLQSMSNVGDPGSIPRLRRSPEEGNGNPPQYSCLENSTDRGAWRATVHGVDKSGLRELPRVPLRGEGSCGGGGAPRDSAGSGADTRLGEVSSALQGLERHPQLSLATRGEDWASQGQPKGKAEIPVVHERVLGDHVTSPQPPPQDCTASTSDHIT